MDDASKDKLIVEALGECWHERDKSYQPLCKKCGKEFRLPINLTSWPGFGWLWPRVQKMEWWDAFAQSIGTWLVHWYITEEAINPTRFRDALAEFLERR